MAGEEEIGIDDSRHRCPPTLLVVRDGCYDDGSDPDSSTGMGFGGSRGADLGPGLSVPPLPPPGPKLSICFGESGRPCCAEPVQLRCSFRCSWLSSGRAPDPARSPHVGTIAVAGPLSHLLGPRRPDYAFVLLGQGSRRPGRPADRPGCGGVVSPRPPYPSSQSAPKNGALKVKIPPSEATSQ
jgi:hypothetical protein